MSRVYVRWGPLFACAFACACVLCTCAGVPPAADDNGPFSCAGASRASLQEVHGCIASTRQRRLTCKRKFARKVSSAKELHYHQEILGSRNASVLRFCLTMTNINWVHENATIEIAFSPEVSVGVIEMENRPPWQLPRFNVKLRSDILSLPLMSLFPDSEPFWNLSSPLFHLPYKWFQRIVVRGSFYQNFVNSVVRALYGTSVQVVKLVGGDGVKFHSSLPAFVNMTSLTELYIYNSYVLSRYCFKNTDNIVVLSMTNNSERALPACVNRLKYLEGLYLTRNRIQNIVNIFRDISSHVKKVSLGYNPIRSLSTRFPRMPNLIGLYLEYCEIFQIPSYAFRGLVSLRILMLTGNRLLFIDPHAFAALPRLRNLYLQNCSLDTWPSASLSGLEFKRLSLSRNLLQHIPNLGSTGTYVWHLDLSMNYIESWSDGDIFSCKGEKRANYSLGGGNATHNKVICLNGTSVADLIMESNLVTALTEPMRKSLGAIRKVDLSGNKINCDDCNTPLVQNWLESTRVKVEPRLRCSFPPAARGQPVAEVRYEGADCGAPFRRLLTEVALGCALGAGAVAIALALYVYRTEVTYLRHLIRVRHASRRADAEGSGRCQYDAFVCYSGRDRKWVLRELTPLLEHGPERFRLCLFDRDFRLGTHIVSNIVDAIDHSAKVVVVLSQPFIESKWCAWELEMANHKLFGEDRSFLVLIELEPLRREGLPRLLRFLMDTRPLVRWPGAGAGPLEVEAAAGQLRRALGPSLSSRPSTSAPGGGGHSQHTPHETTPLLH